MNTWGVRVCVLSCIPCKMFYVSLSMLLFQFSSLLLLGVATNVCCQLTMQMHVYVSSPYPKVTPPYAPTAYVIGSQEFPKSLTPNIKHKSVKY